jgi:hypothetical protein
VNQHPRELFRYKSLCLHQLQLIEVAVLTCFGRHDAT